MFDQYGPRVPAVVISPLCPKNRIEHRQLEHSVIPATVEQVLGLPPLSRCARFAISRAYFGSPPALTNTDASWLGPRRCCAMCLRSLRYEVTDFSTGHLADPRARTHLDRVVRRRLRVPDGVGTRHRPSRCVHVPRHAQRLEPAAEPTAETATQAAAEPTGRLTSPARSALRRKHLVAALA